MTSERQSAYEKVASSQKNKTFKKPKVTVFVQTLLIKTSSRQVRGEQSLTLILTL